MPQKWNVSIVPGQPTAGGIVGPALSLRSVARVAIASCSFATFASAPPCATATAATLAGSVSTAAQQWRLEPAANGAFRIRSQSRFAASCAAAYLGADLDAPSGSGSLGLFSQNGGLTLWRLAKAA